MSRPLARYCQNNHDTWATGRTSARNCLVCKREYERKRRLEAGGGPRLPFAPLRKRLIDNGINVSKHFNHDYVGAWTRVGIPLEKGDEICCELLGCHPVEIWGPDWLALSIEETA